MKSGVLVLGFFGLWAGGTAWNVAVFAEANEHERESRPLILSLPKPEVIKFASMGYAASLADLYWIGSSHYFGEPRYKPVNYSQLHEYVDIVNELAPEFFEPYYFGGAAIPWNTGTQWVNVEAAVEVLRRGSQRFPDDWRLHFLLAYDLGTYLGDFKGAGREMQAAARIPGSPAHLLPLSARYLAFAGDLDQAEALTDMMIETATDENTREVMRAHKDELAVERHLQSLEAALRSYRDSHGGAKPPSPEAKEFQALLPLPFDKIVDPHGDNYRYDPEEGTFSSLTLQRFRPYGVTKAQ